MNTILATTNTTEGDDVIHAQVDEVLPPIHEEIREDIIKAILFRLNKKIREDIIKAAVSKNLNIPPNKNHYKT